MTEVEEPRGLMQESSVSDANICNRFMDVHKGKIARAFAHEMVPNGASYAVQRRDQLAKAQGVEIDPEFTIKQEYHFYDPGEKIFAGGDDVNVYKQPTFVMLMNSNLAAEPAYDLCNFGGEGDDLEKFKDSLFQQGHKVYSMGLGKDTVNMAFGFDARQRTGVAILYKKMCNTKVGEFVPEEKIRNHKHIVVEWFLDDEGNIEWLDINGHTVKTDIEQANLRNFWQYSMFVVKRGSGTYDEDRTKALIEKYIKDNVVPWAERDPNQSCLAMLFTGTSWSGDDPPMWKRRVTDNKYEIVCRPAAGKDAEENPDGVLLSTAVREKWRDVAIKTQRLPCGETLCYRRALSIGIWDIDDYGERNALHDGYVKIVEAGMTKPFGNVAHTQAFAMRGFSEPNASALLRVTLNKGAHDGKIMSGPMYDARVNASDPAMLEAGQGPSGGLVFYLAAFQGTGDDVWSGALTGKEAGDASFVRPSASTLMGTLDHGIKGAKRQFLAFTQMLGCNPQNGHFNEDDLQKLATLLPHGVHGFWALFIDEKERGGLKPNGKRYLLAKIYGYDAMWILEHNLPMDQSKKTLRDPNDGHLLATQVFQNLFLHTMQHDPLCKPVWAKLNDPNFTPAKWENNADATTVIIRQPGGGAAAVPATNANVLTPEEQKRAKKLARHASEHKPRAEKRALDHQKDISELMKQYSLDYLSLATVDELENGNWPPLSAEHALRDLVRQKRGLVTLGEKDVQKDLHIRFPLYALIQINDALKDCTASADAAEELAREKRMNAMWYKVACTFKERFGKRKRDSEEGASGAAGPSGSGSGTDTGGGGDNSDSDSVHGESPAPAAGAAAKRHSPRLPL